MNLALPLGGPTQDPGDERQAGLCLGEHLHTLRAALPKIGKCIGARSHHIQQAPSHAFDKALPGRLVQHAVLIAARTHEIGKRQEGRVLEGRIAHMDVRIHKAGADDAFEIRLHPPRSHFGDDPLPDADVAFQGLEFIAIDDGS